MPKAETREPYIFARGFQVVDCNGRLNSRIALDRFQSRIRPPVVKAVATSRARMWKNETSVTIEHWNDRVTADGLDEMRDSKVMNLWGKDKRKRAGLCPERGLGPLLVFLFQRVAHESYRGCRLVCTVCYIQLHKAGDRFLLEFLK
jgi:hypothetical protein